VVVLEPLSEAELYKIFVGSADSALRQSHAYFASQGIKLEISESAVRRIAAEAARHRGWARAPSRRFPARDPALRVRSEHAPAWRGRLRIEVADVERGLAADETTPPPRAGAGARLASPTSAA